MVLKQVHDTNMRAKGHPERVFSVTHIKTIKREDELIEIQSDTGTWYRRWLVRCLNLSQQVWSNFQQCFAPEFRRVTLMMMAVWFTMSFRCWWHWDGVGWDGAGSTGIAPDWYWELRAGTEMELAVLG
ncbi:synaptic vesicle glycoprotein 2A-like protein [Willisornis vidua]|uniref:Synaptic vesicle glycoprotein 2A-like protein n=1 Tax=Willisornis vidua TaxID=1566151 RepID=A0ABQ9E102_9PASS|nr:synaptic vesicle glycoprotein 2A-like protein [Willisornis vidua]